MNEDQLPQTEDLTENERWVVLAYRRLVEDTKMVKYQAEDGMLNTLGALSMTMLATRTFMDTVNRHVIRDVMGRND